MTPTLSTAASLTVKEAADATGLSVAAIRWHLYGSKDLPYTVRGHTAFIDPADLDKMNRKVGWPTTAGRKRKSTRDRDAYWPTTAGQEEVTK